MPGAAGGFGDEGLPPFERLLGRIMQRTLRTAYDYAQSTPEAVHVYIQIHNSRASADCLFEVEGKLYGVHTLNNSTSNTKFDTTLENQQLLMNSLAMGIKETLELFISHERAMPSEIWTSIRVEGELKSTVLGYNADNSRGVPTTAEAMEEWKKRLEDPSNNLIGELSIAAPMDLSDAV